MKRIEPSVVEASQEKHLPVVSVSRNTVTVNVGSVEHPMTEEHSILWVCLQTDKGIQRKCLEIGKAMLLIATVMLLSGIIGLFEKMLILAVAILIIGFVLGIGCIVAVQKKYNKGVF